VEGSETVRLFNKQGWRKERNKKIGMSVCEREGERMLESVE
jgi:hypothetical protein